MDPTALSNEQEIATEEDMTLDFEDNSIEFGADNCATHHICTDKSLFVGDITPINEFGVRGINGVAPVVGIGIVKLKILDDDENLHVIKCIISPGSFQKLDLHLQVE